MNGGNRKGIPEEEPGKNMAEWLENPFWREYYETAPSEVCRAFIELEFRYSGDGTDEAAEAMDALEEKLSLPDWEHLYRYCGNNPRKARIHERIMKLKTPFPCHIYQNPDAGKALGDMRMETVKDYGDYLSLEDRTTLHWNYVWDDGDRTLCRCRSCGGLFIAQNSEYHSFSDSPDGYYFDMVPVASVEEADLLNILWSASELENYPFRHIRANNLDYFWTRQSDPVPYDVEELKRKIREKYAKLAPEQKEMLEKLISAAGK